MPWSEELRWREFNPNLNIDCGTINIRKICSRNRLVVHSYDSTGILETLSLNIPTLAFWQNDLEHLRESALSYYQKLVDVGILHLSVESITSWINNIWNDVDSWWLDNDVQSARREFCDRYAKTVVNPALKLKQMLDEHN